MLEDDVLFLQAASTMGKNGPKIESLLGSRTSPLLRQVDKPVAVLPFLTSIYAGRSTGRR